MRLVPKLTHHQNQLVHKTSAQTRAYVYNYVNKRCKALAACSLPADQQLVWDSHAADKCSTYKKPIDSIMVSIVWAYALGLASHLRFMFGYKSENVKEPSPFELIGRNLELISADSGSKVDDKSGEVVEKVVAEFLDSVARYVFGHLQCQRNTGTALQLPVSYVEELLNKAQTILNVHKVDTKQLSDSLPGLDDLYGMVRAPYQLFDTEIEKLGSYEGYGRAVVLFTDGKDVFLKHAWKIIVQVSLTRYINAYSGQSQSGYVPSTNAMECPDGFKFGHRLVPVVHAWERCCAEKCNELRGVRLRGEIDREKCCEGCNAFRCNGQRVSEEEAVGTVVVGGFEMGFSPDVGNEDDEKGTEQWWGEDSMELMI